MPGRGNASWSAVDRMGRSGQDEPEPELPHLNDHPTPTIWISPLLLRGRLLKINVPRVHETRNSESQRLT